MSPNKSFLGRKDRAAIVLAQDLEPVEVADETADVALADSEPIDSDATRLFESTWYTRIEYFQWQQTYGDERYLINEGVAPTVGWQQRRGHQRYRFDFFGARADYDWWMDGELISNDTDYLGLRGEYELIWEPVRFPGISVFAGVGSRYFVRSAPDIFEQQTFIPGFQQSWWTFYPYLGFERRRTLRTSGELYSSCRIGMTAYTREHLSSSDVVLFPRPNITLQSEIGWRGPRLSLAFFTELMEWSVSPKVLNEQDDYLYWARQPESALLTLGGRVAWSR